MVPPRTSSNIGHKYVQPPPPPVELRRDVPLPPILQRSSQVCVSAGPRLSFTSSALAHSGTPQAAWQVQSRYPKPPAHWGRSYLSDLDALLRSSPSHRLVSAPISETDDSYRRLNAAQAPVSDNYRPLLTLSKHLQTSGFLEAPISTCHAHYRRHTCPELSSVDVSPAQKLEKLLKSSTHIRRPLSADTPPVLASPSPVQFVPRPLLTLPFAGKNSEYQDAFAAPPAPPPNSCESPGAGGGASGALKHVMDVPKMYKTENSNYGSQKMALV